MRTLLLSLILVLPAWLGAGTFDIKAEVDRDQLELGESLRLKLTLHVQGQLDFRPQLDPPHFDGFEARGPQTFSNMNWVNGSMTMEQGLIWDLVAVKSGSLSLGPLVVKGKDALHGDIVRKTQPITVTVRRPKDLGLRALAPQPTFEPSAPQQLYGIKGDRPFPWQLWALAGVGGVALLALLLTLWRRRPAKPLGPPPPRDPAQWALEQLERLRQARLEGHEREQVRAMVDLLRDYLRHRLPLAHEATLSEGLRRLHRQAPGLEGLGDTGLRLNLLLYSGAPVEPADEDWAYAALRELIIKSEQALPPPGAAPAAAPQRTTRTRGRHGQ